MKKYQIIYADPPWDSRKSQWGGESRYPTMKIKDICALPIKEITDTDAILFLWTIGCHLQNAMKVIESWGFKYKTVGFNWAKVYRNGSLYSGLGHWTKQGSELCLLATKGKPHRINKGVKQLISVPITRHSAKPVEIRDRIVTLMGDLPRIELFARKEPELFDSFEGWDVWGNEVESDIEL